MMGRVRVSRSGFQYLFQKNHRKYYNMEKCVGIEKSGGCRDALHIIINFLRFSMPVLRTKGQSRRFHIASVYARVVPKREPILSGRFALQIKGR